MQLWSSSPEVLREAMLSAGLRRGWLVTDPVTGELRSSHPLFAELAEVVAADRRDYRAHEGWFVEIGSESGHLLSATVHRTRRGQAAGGVRFWSYDTLEGFVRDGLRLSRGMGHKNALAGLWWGGGKGVIARRPGLDPLDPALRAGLYRDYGRFVSGLCGCYVTAEDVGTTPPDMARVFTTTRYTTCIPVDVGGSGNPSVLTSTGVVVAMEAALAWLGKGDLRGKTVAMQGLGNVARFMIGDLLERGVARVTGADVDERAIAETLRRFPGAPIQTRLAPVGDTSILAEACDILVPNATGAMLNPNTIPGIRATVVCGAANNQLEDALRDAPALQERGVLYVPDFLANRMGIVNCANEQYGSFPDDPAIMGHLDRDTPTGIYRRAMEIFERARRSGRPPALEAEVLADELSEQLHPLWGHRSRLVIDALVAGGWENRAPISG